MKEIRSIPGGVDAWPHPHPKFDPWIYEGALTQVGVLDGGEGFAHVQSPAKVLNHFSAILHSANVHAGWWTNIETGEPKPRNVPELLCLVHSELSEALEGHRKGKQDDHLPHRPSIEVELADAMIRMFDLAGALQLDLGGALMEKLAYNANRADHKIENRLKADGKKL